MKLKRKKIGDRAYELIDVATGEVMARAAKTGEHGRDNYPWDWHLEGERIFGRLDASTGRSEDSLRDAVDHIESEASHFGFLAPVGKIDVHAIKEGQVFRVLVRSGGYYFFRATQDAYYSGMDDVTITANNHKGVLKEVKLPFKEEVTLFLPEREARREQALIKAKEEDSKVESALAAMVRKIDERRPGFNGYITNRDELIAILKEVTPHISVGIYHDGEYGDDISVEIRVRLTLERGLL